MEVRGLTVVDSMDYFSDLARELEIASDLNYTPETALFSLLQVGRF